MSRNIDGMCFDCSWFGNICEGGVSQCHQFESKFEKKGEEGVSKVCIDCPWINECAPEWKCWRQA